MILNQWSRKNCWIYATMAILQHKWILFDIARFSELQAPYINIIEKTFKEANLIKRFIPIQIPRLVDYWLSRWEYILTGTPRGDFTLENNDWWLVEFDERSQHWFVIIENCWDTWKCQNSWWPDWNWDGCFHIKKSDFWYLFTPRRILWNTQK